MRNLIERHLIPDLANLVIEWLGVIEINKIIFDDGKRKYCDTLMNYMMENKTIDYIEDYLSSKYEFYQDCFVKWKEHLFKLCVWPSTCAFNNDALNKCIEDCKTLLNLVFGEEYSYIYYENDTQDEECIFRPAILK